MAIHIDKALFVRRSALLLSASSSKQAPCLKNSQLDFFADPRFPHSLNPPNSPNSLNSPNSPPKSPVRCLVLTQGLRPLWHKDRPLSREVLFGHFRWHAGIGSNKHCLYD